MEIRVEEKKKSPVLLILFLIIIMTIAIIVIVASGDSEEEKPTPDIGNSNITEDIENGIVGETEKEVSFATMHKIFEWIPKVTMEGSIPFTEEFKLSAAMKMIEKVDEPDFTASSVISVVKKIFGSEASLDVNAFEFSKLDLTIAKYYYEINTNMFYIVPMGMESTYCKQILKTVTETPNEYYVYAYDILGEYFIDEEGKVTVFIGDKNGKDIIKEFEKAEDIQNYDIWVDEFKDILPIYKYTLKKAGEKYYLTSVYHINY